MFGYDSTACVPMGGNNLVSRGPGMMAGFVARPPMTADRKGEEPARCGRTGLGGDCVCGGNAYPRNTVVTLALPSTVTRNALPGTTALTFTCTACRRAHRLSGDDQATWRNFFRQRVISSLPRPSRYRATLAVRTQTDCSENEPACTSSIGDSVQNLPSSDAAIGGLETSMIVDGTEPVIQNDRQKWVSDGDAEGKTRILIDRLLALFDLTEGEALYMIRHHPALLSLPEEQLAEIMEDLRACLAPETESELLTAIRKQPTLLVLGAARSLKDKIEVLSKAGLTLGEARTALMASPQSFLIDETELQSGVDTLRDVLALNLGDIAKVVTRMPSILTESLEALQSQRSFYIDELCLRPHQLRSWVVKDPSILRLRVADDLRPKFVYFERELRVSRVQLVKLVERQPQILALDLETRIRPNVEYLESELRIPPKCVARMIVAVPGLLWLSINDTLKRKVRWMSTELMLRRDQLRKIISHHPQVLTLSVEKNLGPKVSWLKIAFGIDDLELRDMIVRHPPLLLYSIDTTIKPKMSFLREVVGVEEIRLRKMVVLLPALFSYSVQTMQAKVDFFTEELHMDEDVANVISRCPQVLGYSIATMKAKVSFIEQVLHTSGEETRKILARYPTILNLSIEKNLRLKLDFYLQELNGRPTDVRTAIVGSPSLLGYSLTKRIRPRLQVMRHLGIEPTFSDHHVLLTSCSYVKYRKWVEKQVIKLLGAEGRGDLKVRSWMNRCSVILQDCASIR